MSHQLALLRPIKLSLASTDRLTESVRGTLREPCHPHASYLLVVLHRTGLYMGYLNLMLSHPKLLTEESHATDDLIAPAKQTLDDATVH